MKQIYRILSTKFMKRPLSLSMRGFFLLSILFLLAFPFAPKMQAQSNADQWTTIGWGTFIDGWITDKGDLFPLTVEIQQDKNNPRRYRVWQPYKTFNEYASVLWETETNGEKVINSANKAKYENVSNCIEKGQIVIDLTNPEKIIVECNELAGFKNAQEKYWGSIVMPGELICTNALAYYTALGHPYLADSMAPPTTYDEEKRCIIIPKAYITTTSLDMAKGEATSYIFFPQDYDPGIHIPTEEEKELEPGQWTSLGIGKLIDGWVTNGEEFDVEIQQSVSYPSRYRVWEPYKELEEKTGLKRNSNYHGQIVFDVSDPEYVLIFPGKAMGYYEYNILSSEAHALNEFGFHYARLEVENQPPSEQLKILESLKNQEDLNVYGKTTFENNVVTIEKTMWSRPLYNQRTLPGNVAKIILPQKLTEEEIWEEEEGKWEFYGMGKLVDGWLTDGIEFDVEIQKDINSDTRFRVWNPYKDLEEKTDLKKNSAYRGQIVFDVEDPAHVLLEVGKPLGQQFSGKYTGEMYATNDYGYYLNTLGLNQKDLAKTLTDSMGKPTTYSDGVVTIVNAKHIGKTETGIFDNLTSTDRQALIYMPEKPGNWEFKVEDDYFDFTLGDEKVEVEFDSDAKVYRMEDVTEPVKLKATIKPEFTSYLIHSIEATPSSGGTINISDDRKEFSLMKPAFAGDFTFDITVNKVKTVWEIVADDDYFAFTCNEEPVEVVYDSETMTYRLDDVEESSVILASIKPEFVDYKILSVAAQFDTNSTSPAQARAASAQEEMTLPEIAPDGQSFQLNMKDFVGGYRFMVEVEKPMIYNIGEPITSVTQSSAFIRIPYNCFNLPDDATIQAFYGPATADAGSYEDYVIGLASGVSITVTGLEAETAYTYNVVFKIFTDDGEVIFTSSPLAVTFKTNSEPVVNDEITVKEYMWDNTTIPENKYGVCTYFTYKLGAETQWPQFKPSIEVIRGTYFNETHKKGVRELTLHFAHLLPNPPVITEDEELLVIGKWFIVKNPTKESSGKENLWIPTSPEGYGENEIYELITESGVTYKGLTSVTLGLDDKKTGGLTDYEWEMDKLNHFALESKEKVYNVILVIGFDEEDDQYDTPKYIRIEYEREPQTTLIGTIAQTSPLFDPKKDNVGGWHTWVPLTPTGDAENPYPYVYDFIAQEPAYDFSFTFDNKRLLKTLGNGDVMDSFDLQEIYPHNMAWNSGFESPSNWHSQTRGRDIKPQQTNYYPGYIGPYVSGIRSDSQGLHEPSFIESIRLTDLVPGHHYQLVIDHPSYGWETDKKNPTFTYICNALGYVSLIDFDVEEGFFDTYQLVLDEMQTVTNADTDEEYLVYYTYDLNDTGCTYKVVLDKNDQVISYKKVYNVYEAEDYKRESFRFTDKFFVFAHGYEYDEVNDKNVSVNVIEASADLVLEDAESRRISVKGEDVNVATVFSMSDEKVREAFEEKNFDIKDYSIRYQRGYTTCDDNTLELFVTDRPVTHRMPWQFELNIPKEKRLYDAERMKLPYVRTENRLVVPTPIAQTAEIEMSYGSEITGAGDKDAVKTFTFIGKKTESDGSLKEYELKDARYHNLREVVEILPPNVTDDLRDLMTEENSYWFQYSLNDTFFGDNNTDSYTGNVYRPEHFYPQNGYKDKSIPLDIDEHTPTPHIYDRWDTARVSGIDLTTEKPLYDEDKWNPMYSSVNIQGNELGYSSTEEGNTVLSHLFKIFVSFDALNHNGVLRKGETEFDSKAEMRHYYDSNYSDRSGNYFLISIVECDRDENGNIIGDETILEEDVISADVIYNEGEGKIYEFRKDYISDHWYAEQVEEVLKNPYYNHLEVRASYLYPFDETAPASAPKTGMQREQAQKTGQVIKSEATVWRFEDREVPTSVEGIVDFQLPYVVGAGYIDVFASDVEIFNVAGMKVGSGEGRHLLEPAIYLLHHGSHTAKVIVK